MKKSKTQKGITLIALIITIVVLLILAVVTINAIQGDGIIEYASNAADEYTAKADEEQETINTLLGQIEGSLREEEKITWTKTSEGELAIGSTVKHIATNEEFYVIGFAGTNNETVKLLAKYSLNEDSTIQYKNDEEGTTTYVCAFSTLGDLSFTEQENLNNNSILKADTTSAVYKAMKYGEILGVTTGRLMTAEEVEALGGTRGSYTSDCRSNGYSFVNLADYWLGTAASGSDVWMVDGGNDFFSGYNYDGEKGMFGVRPVVEILKSNIS